MTPKKIAAGIAAAGVLAGGGAIATDQAINPYDSVGTTLQAETVSTLPQAGTDKAIMDTTKPKMTLEKWNGEVAMGVTYEGMQATGARPFLSKNVEWSDGNQTMQVVPLEASSTMEDGGYEINVILNAPPASNVFHFSIDGADNLNFYYQPALAPEEVKDGLSRPDNVVGSYAVYYKDHANHKVGSTNYATGKAYHIFRPLVTDAKSAKVWAELSYSNGVLIVTVPQSFLDAAVYPVNVDPTFGYTTQGASTEAGLPSNLHCTTAITVSDTGTIDSISAIAQASGGTTHTKGVLVEDAGLTIVTNGVTPQITTGAGAGTKTMPYSTHPAITSGLSYHACRITDLNDANFTVWYYDNLGSVSRTKDTTNSFSSPTNPTDMTGSNLFTYSIYATYTATAAASSQSPLPEF